MTETMRVSQATVIWGAAFGVLIVLAIPWFLWRVDRVIVGLPIWLWWHIGWMLLAAGVFWLFTRRAWGIGIPAGGERP